MLPIKENLIIIRIRCVLNRLGCCLLAAVLIPAAFTHRLYGQVPEPAHVVIVIEENHDYEQIVGNFAAPFINALIADSNAALFTHYTLLRTLEWMHGLPTVIADTTVRAVTDCWMRFTSAGSPDSGRKEDPVLRQNYPNPFNPATNIRYTVSTAGSGVAGERMGGGIVNNQSSIVNQPAALGAVLVRLAVYDVLGREVSVLVDEAKAPGSYTVTWNAAGMSSGVCFYRVNAGSFTDVKKMAVLR